MQSWHSGRWWPSGQQICAGASVLQEGSQPNGKTPFGEGITWQYEGPLGWRNFVPDNTGSQPSGYTALHFACDGSSRGFDNHGPPSPSSLIWMRAEERLHREAEPEMCSLDVRKQPSLSLNRESAFKVPLHNFVTANELGKTKCTEKSIVDFPLQRTIG